MPVKSPNASTIKDEHAATQLATANYDSDSNSDIESLEKALVLFRVESDTPDATTNPCDDQKCPDEGTVASSTSSRGHKDVLPAKKSLQMKEVAERKDSLDLKRAHRDCDTRPQATIPLQDDKTFRWDFGKYRGQTIAETPPEYVQWTISLSMFYHRTDMRWALISNGYSLDEGDSNDGVVILDRNLWISPRHAHQFFQVHARDMACGGYTVDDSGNYALVEVVTCSMEILGQGDAHIAQGMGEFLSCIRRS